MLSATPKHLHPILGRRMVDWIVEAARPLGADALVVVVSPDTADEFEGLNVAVQAQPLGTGDAVRSARAGGLRCGRGARPLGRHAAAHERAARRPARDPSLAGRGRHRPLVRARRHPQLRPHRSQRATAISSRSSRRPTHRPSSSRSARRTRRSTSSGPTCSGRRSTGSQPVNAQGELYLTDAVRDLVGGGHRVVVHVAPDPDETEGVNTRVELAAAAAALRDRINTAHMLAGVTIDDPATTWIEPTVTLAADTVVHPFTILRGATSVAEGAEIGPHAVVDRCRDRTCRDRRALLLRSARYGARCAGEGWHVRGDQEHATGRGREGSPSQLFRRRGGRSWNEHRRGIDHGELRPPSRCAKEANGDRAGRTRRGRHDVCRPRHGGGRCLDGGRHGRHRGCPGQRSRRVPAEADDQGGSRWKAGPLSRRFPGSGCPICR